jgi:hypothetical protein
MANGRFTVEERATLSDLVRGVGPAISGFVSGQREQGRETTEQIAAANTVNQANILGFLGGTRPQDILQPEAKARLQSMEINQQAAEKELSRRATEQAQQTPTEDLQNFVNTDAVAQDVSNALAGGQAGQQNQQQVAAAADPATAQQAAPDQAGQADTIGKVFSFLGLDPSKGLMQQGGVTEEGVAFPGTSFFGLIQEVPQNVLARQQAQALTPAAKKQEALENFFIDIKKEEIKQGLIAKREILKEQAKAGKGIGLDEVASNISDFVKTWDNLSTGPVRGNISRLFAKFGAGNEELTTLESMSDIMVFTLGGYFTGQTGRAFSDRDREIIGKALKISPATKGRDFIGKLQSAINFTNAKIKGETLEGETPQLLPNAKQMIQNVRSGKDPITGGQATTTAAQQTLPGTKQVTQVGRFQVEVE